jgi:hypothetical protein
LLIKRIILSDFAALSVVSIFIMAFTISGYSRLIIFGTVGIAAITEILLGNLYFLLIHTINGRTDLINPEPRKSDLKQASMASVYRERMISDDAIKNAVLEECGREGLEFIMKHNNLIEPKVLALSTTTRFNIEFQPDNYFEKVINLKRTNDIQFINKFFESVNRKIPIGGFYTGCVETKNQRKTRILNKFPPIIRWFMYSLDFVIKRVFPKFILTKTLFL